ncbi:MAG: hypothetical protein QNL04_12495 [SAR324 cluster bacterium]|nr:hypothetical protein [SAR324 cluster bacterium]
MNKAIQKIVTLFMALTLVLTSLSSCKDTSATHQAGLLETCMTYSDQKKWSDAVTACALIDTDDGKHLTAQAYMGLAGLSLFDVISGLSTVDDPMTLILDKIPATTGKAKNYHNALQIIMDDITVKTNTMYLEALLLSSMLVYKELSTLFELKVKNGAVTNCASSGSLEDCSFTFTVTKTAGYASGLVFDGLGADFYDAICQDRDSAISIAASTALTHTITNTITSLSQSQSVSYDMTVDSCTIRDGSPMAYNKLAGEGISGFDDLADSLSQLKIYDEIDQGVNFTQSVDDLTDDISICNTGYITPPVSGDGIINDCEILGYLNPPAN